MDKFLELLIEKGIIKREILQNLKKQSDLSETPIEELLISQGVVEEDLIKIKSEALGAPAKFLKGEKVLFEVLKAIPEESARYYKFVPLEITEEGILEIGMINPADLKAQEAIQFIASKLNLPFKIYLIAPSDFKEVMEEYKAIGAEVTQALGELEQALQEKTPLKPIKSLEEETIIEEAPIIKIVAVVLKHAIEGRASDIHIEPIRGKLKIRFRVDGALYNALLLPIKVHEGIITRIKILTNMQLDEKRKPQDGRFSTRISGRDIDFRVSTFPTYFGEKAVIRILDPQKEIFDLEKLGLQNNNLEIVKKNLKKPWGLVLITGPTGSGKTTTLYAMLQMLDREKYNIVSLEDPIEYNVEGVNQSQVRPEIDYDFANGLRSILRQDPDIIMVGEIRDSETANLAIHAALTGHLVFSTLHTNNAIGAIPRLIDMGVDPYLIPPTLIIVMAQRLARTLCEDSRKELEVKGKVKEKLEEEMKEMPETVKKKFGLPSKIYQALPSSTCPKGTRGRIGVFEVLEMTPAIEKLILTKPTEKDIMEEARKQGMITMKEDGILKIIKGKIGMEELWEII